ncbi:MAG: hypothetical protein ACREOS_03150, partial [Candidatus Dormibacteraceae bacterium]
VVKTGNSESAPYECWVKLVSQLTQTPQGAFRHRKERSNYTAEIASTILRAAGLLGEQRGVTRNRLSPVVYGVWLDGHEPSQPVYIGQTRNAARRLWDLPIGESHHLANTFPPEIWARVVVLRWPEILAREGDGSVAVRPIDDVDLGHGVEYALQHRYKPLMNLWSKKRNGDLNSIDLARSNSRGAKIASSSEFVACFSRVVTVWDELSRRSQSEKEWESLEFGGIAFPSRVYRRMVRRHREGTG